MQGDTLRRRQLQEEETEIRETKVSDWIILQKVHVINQQESPTPSQDISTVYIVRINIFCERIQWTVLGVNRSGGRQLDKCESKNNLSQWEFHEAFPKSLLFLNQNYWSQLNHIQLHPYQKLQVVSRHFNRKLVRTRVLWRRSLL